MNPTKRRSLAEQIRAGTTPEWYSSLPTDVRNYMGRVRSQVQDGALTQPVSTSSTVTATGSEAGTGTGSGASKTNAASGGKDRMMRIGLVEVVAMGIAMML